MRPLSLLENVRTPNTETAFRQGVSTGTANAILAPPLDLSLGPFASSESYDVSVVVPTFNRQQLLGRTLETLVQQRAGSVRYEVLVVDNNSTDDTRAVVETFVHRWRNVRYFFEPRPGVSHARNTGIAAARSPLIAFIDDDVEADPTWIATIKQTFDEHPAIDCVGGRIEPRWAAPPPAWLTPNHWGAVALQAATHQTRLVHATNASRCLPTANFASRRAALEQVGGFSPDYLRGEDRELQLRLWAAGKRGLYVDEIAATTEVPLERMTKAYHRQFYRQAGATHARMRYRDRIDREGRLIPQDLNAAMFLGVPGYIYRDLFRHAVAWLGRVAILDWTGAFFHESRTLYFANYVRGRIQQHRPAVWTIPLQFVRFAGAVLRTRTRITDRVRA